MRYQYFSYSAEVAQQNARMNGAQKGPRCKLTNLIVDAFLLELVFWGSVPAAWHALHRKKKDIPAKRKKSLRAGGAFAIMCAFFERRAEQSAA